jgi:hypothetical protein
MARAMQALADTYRADGREAMAEVFERHADRLERQPETYP